MTPLDLAIHSRAIRDRPAAPRFTVRGSRLLADDRTKTKRAIFVATFLYLLALCYI